MNQKPVNYSRRALVAGAAALGLSAMLPRIARADAWQPQRTVKLTVPTPPGGPTDLVARLLAEYLQKAWNQPVVVENKGGAGGTLAAGQFVRQPADGSCLFIGNPGSNATAYSMYRGLSYRPEQFLPVCGIAKVAGLVSVHPSLPVSTLGELVDYVRARPGQLNFATAGTGQSTHLAAAWFVQQAGLKITHVPYKGGSAALTAVLAGEVPILFNVVMPDIPFVREGRLRAIAVMTADRTPIAPEVPTMRESMPDLLSDFDFASWYGAFLPQGTPEEIVAEVSMQTRNFLQSESTRERLAGAGAQVDWRSPAEFAAFVKAEQQKFAVIIDREGLQRDLG